MNSSCLKESVIDSQPTWIVQNETVELSVTKLGAHMAPVLFCRNESKPVQPYYISPWQNEKTEGLPPAMIPLRGDFFCLPFGSNPEPYRGEQHPIHGETSGSEWTLGGCTNEGEATTLQIQLKTKNRPGTVRRQFTLINGHNVVYCKTTIEGFAGPTTFAHHAILRLPHQEKALLLSTSPFSFGRTYPIQLSNPAVGEYQYLAKNGRFRSLSKVQSLFKGEPPADYSAVPVNPGFCDLLHQFERPTRRQSPSWVAAVHQEENWMWFALKNPAVMPGRLFWIENGGRHGSPWNGRNRCIGIEDGCMYFDRGIAEASRNNPINEAGIPTSVELSSEHPFEVRYIQGAVRVPPTFDRVIKVRSTADSTFFHAASGDTIEVPLNRNFLFNKTSPLSI